MLYLAIDQHAKQITVCVRTEDGDTVLRRQVSTRLEKIEAFFQQLTEMDAQFMAILEVCGFNDWLIARLRKWNCQEIVLIHPEKPSKKKTDRRDAHKLADLLWLNRERLAARGLDPRPGMVWASIRSLTLRTTSGSRSSTTTRCPSRERRIAVWKPTSPAPMINTCMANRPPFGIWRVAPPDGRRKPGPSGFSMGYSIAASPNGA